MWKVRAFGAPVSLRLGQHRHPKWGIAWLSYYNKLLKQRMVRDLELYGSLVGTGCHADTQKVGFPPHWCVRNAHANMLATASTDSPAHSLMFQDETQLRHGLGVTPDKTTPDYSNPVAVPVWYTEASLPPKRLLYLVLIRLLHGALVMGQAGCFL